MAKSKRRQTKMTQKQRGGGIFGYNVRSPVRFDEKEARRQKDMLRQGFNKGVSSVSEGATSLGRSSKNAVSSVASRLSRGATSLSRGVNQGVSAVAEKAKDAVGKVQNKYELINQEQDEIRTDADFVRKLRYFFEEDPETKAILSEFKWNAGDEGYFSSGGARRKSKKGSKKRRSSRKVSKSRGRKSRH